MQGVWFNIRFRGLRAKDLRLEGERWDQYRHHIWGTSGDHIGMVRSTLSNNSEPRNLNFTYTLNLKPRPTP